MYIIERSNTLKLEGEVSDDIGVIVDEELGSGDVVAVELAVGAF